MDNCQPEDISELVFAHVRPIFAFAKHSKHLRHRLRLRRLGVRVSQLILILKERFSTDIKIESTGSRLDNLILVLHHLLGQRSHKTCALIPTLGKPTLTQSQWHDIQECPFYYAAHMC